MAIIHCLDMAIPKISLTLNGWISTVENSARIFNATKSYTNTMEYIQRKADQNGSTTALFPPFWCMYSIYLLNQIGLAHIN